MGSNYNPAWVLRDAKQFSDKTKEAKMTTDTPVKIMYMSPFGNRGADDNLFAKMAEDYRLPDTEVHITSLPDDDGSFTHIEFPLL